MLYVTTKDYSGFFKLLGLLSGVEEYGRCVH